MKQGPRGLLVRAPAKVNPWLRIGRKRPDGYHEIETVFATVGLFDEVRISAARNLEFDVAGLPSPRDETNLMCRAAVLLRSAARTKLGARLELTKAIPAGAGLGGGSADAAAALAGLNRFWRLGWSNRRLRTLGAPLGADVPFCLLGGAALGTGTGDRLKPIPWRLKAWAAILKPSVGSPTGPAYAAWDRMGNRQRRVCPAATLKGVLNALQGTDLGRMRAHNDFEAALFPATTYLAGPRARLIEAGATPAFLTGSGSASVGLFPTRSAALQGLAAATGLRTHRRPRSFRAVVPFTPLRITITPI